MNGPLSWKTGRGRLAFTLSLPLLVCMAATGAQSPQMPMPVHFEDSAQYRWMQKPVLASRLLDDMENPGQWTLEGRGEMSYTRERAIDGMQSLRIHSHVVAERGSPSVYVSRRFQEEDWSGYNRVSFWVYADFPGFDNIGLLTAINTVEKDNGLGAFGRDSKHYFNLKNHRWTRVIWEFSQLPRTKVTEFVIQYVMIGRPPGATGEITLDIDHVELQRVEPDDSEGWSVAPGTISLSYSGYQTGAKKTALASDLTARDFELIRAIRARSCSRSRCASKIPT